MILYHTVSSSKRCHNPRSTPLSLGVTSTEFVIGFLWYSNKAWLGKSWWDNYGLNHHCLSLFPNNKWRFEIWLVVFTILKNISQWEGLFPIYGKIKKCSKPPISLIWFNWENDPKNGIIVHDHLKVGMNGNDNLWCHFFFAMTLVTRQW